MLLALAAHRAGQRHLRGRRPTRAVQLAAAPEMRGRVMALYGDRLPRLHADRRADRRLAGGRHRPARRPGARRRRGARDGAGRVGPSRCARPTRRGASPLGHQPELDDRVALLAQLGHRPVDPLLGERRDLEALDDLVDAARAGAPAARRRCPARCRRRRSSAPPSSAGRRRRAPSRGRGRSPRWPPTPRDEAPRASMISAPRLPTRGMNSSAHPRLVVDGVPRALAR